MTRILKYPLPPFGEATVKAGYEISRWLAVEWQHDQLVVWAEATPSEEHTHRLYVAQTGEPCPAGRWIGTAQMVGPGGHYVVHVYVENPA